MVFSQFIVFVGVDSHFFGGSVGKVQFLEHCELVPSRNGFGILVFSLFVRRMGYLFIYLVFSLFVMKMGYLYLFIYLYDYFLY